jgi:hypothetical protein
VLCRDLPGSSVSKAGVSPTNHLRSFRVTKKPYSEAKLPSRLRLSDPERASLAEIGKRLGPKAFPSSRLRRHGIAPAPKRSQTTLWRVLSMHI